jgi:hypothetical protein
LVVFLEIKKKEKGRAQKKKFHFFLSSLSPSLSKYAPRGVTPAAAQADGLSSCSGDQQRRIERLLESPPPRGPAPPLIVDDNR